MCPSVLQRKLWRLWKQKPLFCRVRACAHARETLILHSLRRTKKLVGTTFVMLVYLARIYKKLLRTFNIEVCRVHPHFSWIETQQHLVEQLYLVQGEWKGNGTSQEFHTQCCPCSRICRTQAHYKVFRSRRLFRRSLCFMAKGDDRKYKLIRQYIPKQANFDEVTDKKIAIIQKKINNRPRQKLNFETLQNEFFKRIA